MEPSQDGFDPSAVRTVCELLTLWVADEDHQGPPDPLLPLVLREASDNARNCLPVLLGIAGSLIVQLAETESEDPSDLWQHRALAMAATFPDGGN
ncbi:hypothetical protein ACWGKK_12775 [Streptomyces chartreusis]